MLLANQEEHPFHWERLCGDGELNMDSKTHLQFHFCLLIAGAAAAMDQATKFWVTISSLPEQPFVIAPFLRLVYAENTGAAFSILAEQGEWARWLLAGLSAAVCIFLLIWLRKFPPPRSEGVALSLILGGAFGNFIDRFRQGYVVDFIDAHIGDWHWPAFNIADSAITLGALLLICRLIFPPKSS